MQRHANRHERQKNCGVKILWFFCLYFLCKFYCIKLSEMKNAKNMFTDRRSLTFHNSLSTHQVTNVMIRNLLFVYLYLEH